MKKRILVVDDDQSIRESLKKVLEELGYETALAPDGADVNLRVQAQKFDLVILDLNMPRRNGWAVLENLSTAHPMIPVLVITGLSNPASGTTFRCQTDVMLKPIDVPVLLKKIEALLAETPEARLRRLSGTPATGPARRINPGDPLIPPPEPPDTFPPHARPPGT